jgi:hypothetical protein
MLAQPMVDGAYGAGSTFRVRPLTNYLYCRPSLSSYLSVSSPAPKPLEDTKAKAMASRIWMVQWRREQEMKCHWVVMIRRPASRHFLFFSLSILSQSSSKYSVSLSCKKYRLPAITSGLDSTQLVWTRLDSS